MSDSVEELAHRADSRGAARRAGDLRAVAEHLRAKEAKDAKEVERVTVDVRPEALGRGRHAAVGGSRMRSALQTLGRRVRRLVTR